MKKSKKINTRMKITSLLLTLLLLNKNTAYSIDVTEDYTNDSFITGTGYYGFISGINIDSDDLSIKNNGIIKILSNQNGSGIRSQSAHTKEIINNGIIEGNSTDKQVISSSPNGTAIINNFKSSIGKIINSGFLLGFGIGEETGGTGIHNGTNGTTVSGIPENRIGLIENSGVISGFTDLKSAKYGADELGNGIGNLSIGDDAIIETINNKGLILGKTINDDKEYSENSGNGIMSYGPYSIAKVGPIQNSGIISGSISDNSIETTTFSGNGISNGTKAIMDSINNNGIISGAYTANDASDIPVTTRNGITNKGTINSIENNGVVKGGVYPIYGTFKNLNNNGLLIGSKMIVTPYSHKAGVELVLNTDTTIKEIHNGTGGSVILADGSTKNVVNGEVVGTDSFTNSSILTKNSDLIINGVGFNKGALVVDSTSTVDNSIINAYKTAIYLEGANKFTGTNTIFNGGGVDGSIDVIKGDAGNNSLEIDGNSIINGNTNLSEGDDKFLVSNETQINGSLNGGTGNDTLGLGKNNSTKTPTSLNIYHNISGFENINTNGDMTLFENIAITGASNINLENGNLTLRVDPSKMDSDGKIIGHALYGNTGTINSTNGKLVVGLNGLGEDSIISMGETTISQNINNSNWWEDSDKLTTNSLVLDGTLSSDGKNINITVRELIELFPSMEGNPTIPLLPIGPESEIPEPPVVNPEPEIETPTPENPNTVIDEVLYTKLNQVYKSIVSSKEIGKLANTTLLEGKTENESLGGLLTILDQVYANNPYAYTLKSSKDSLKTFEDNMSYLTIKPEQSEWIVQGKGIYAGVKNDNDGLGKNYYGFDTGHRNYKTTTNIVGGVATFEYGLDNNTSAGIAFGGNNQDINFKGVSSLDINSLYLGIFGKKEINNFKFISKLGYQYSSADGERVVGNAYDYFEGKDNYDINTFNVSTEMKYVIDMENGTRFEPKIKLSYYNVNQDSINEGYDSKNLTIGADSQESNTLDIKLGVDLIKEKNLKIGKLNTILSLGVTNTIMDREKSLTGQIIGKETNGSKFEIKSIAEEEFLGTVGYTLELEQQNGMIYTAGTSFEFGQEGSRNLTAQLGIGYKF